MIKTPELVKDGSIEANSTQPETADKIESQIKKFEEENQALTELLTQLNTLKNRSGADRDKYKELKDKISAELNLN